MNSNKSTISDKVRNYIVQASHVGEEKIKNESLIFKEGYFDSMGFIMLIAFLEETFSIKTNDDDLMEENFESINAITDFVHNKIKN